MTCLTSFIQFYFNRRSSNTNETCASIKTSIERQKMPARLTTEEFIKRSRELYGNKYNYSNVNYKNTNTKISIVCPIHGEFLVWPNNFLRGHGCPACNGRERITEDVFISRATVKHQNRYKYSEVDYKGLYEPVSIICPIHGIFKQKPIYHLNGNGCPKCYGTPKSTTTDFIAKAKAVYGELYDYSKVEYSGNKTKVCIICPQHGEWMVTPNNFLRGSRCPKCYGTPKHTTDEFIKMAKEIHGKKYDYSYVQYDGMKRKVKICCPIHGIFEQTASSHIRGSGCPECVTILSSNGGIYSRSNKKITRDSFVKKAVQNHSIRYDYSNVEFNRMTEKICIICPQHGKFWQNARYHMLGGNCPKCVGGVRIDRETFIRKAIAIHGNKYDYKNVQYKNYNTKVCIICPEHGDFWQTPNNHLFGTGCPTCPQSNLEGEMRNFLTKNGIEFFQEHRFDWLKSKKRMSLDFYLPQHNIAIECQGKQHFEPINMFGGEEFFEKTLERDLLKKKLCEEHGIKVIYFSNAHIDYPYTVFESFTELLSEIEHRN